MNWDLLGKRFPDLSFLLSLSSFSPVESKEASTGHKNYKMARGWLYGEDIAQELCSWKDSLPLEKVTIVYHWGIGLGYHYEALKDWLLAKQERMLIFFEDDLQVLELLFSSSLGEDLLSNPKVHIVYIPEEKAWEGALEASVQTWLSDRIIFTALPSYAAGKQKKIEKIRSSLLQKASLVHVGMAELLYYPLLAENIIANFLSLPEGFHVNQMKGCCEGIPAIICGAGASLMDEMPLLQSLQGQALVIAGGSAITALGHQGVLPHIAIALDPNDEEYARLKESSVFEVPFVYSARLHKEVLSCMNVRPGYLCSDTGGSLETWLQKELGIPEDSLGPELGVEALSVTTLAVPLARYLGCSPILFCGVDLSYRGKLRYSPGVLPSAEVNKQEMKEEIRALERLVRKKNREGKQIDTLVKWVMEASCIGAYAKKHQETLFFTASRTGLPIPNVPYLSLEEFLQTHAKKREDLVGLLHAKAQGVRFSCTLQEVLHPLEGLQASLHRSISLAGQMLEEVEKRLLQVENLSLSPESGLMRLLEMDLCEEVAHEACLHYPFHAYQKTLERVYPSWFSLDTVEGRRCFLEKKRDLWREYRKAAEDCIRALEMSFLICR